MFLPKSVYTFFISMSMGLLLLAGQARAGDNSFSHNGTSVTYKQTAAGLAVDIQDARGVTTHYQYDPKGWLIQERSAERGLTTYEYDEAGNLIRQTLEGDIVIRRHFDNKNRLTKEVFRQDGAQRKASRFTYDACEKR